MFSMEKIPKLRCTKIICTLGPSSNTKQIILALLDAGMNIIRMNFSHGTHQQHEHLLTIIKDIRNESEYIFGIALDTKGPEIRAMMEQEIQVKRGDKLRFTSKKESEMIQIENVDLNDIEMGYEFTLDDGLLRVKVVDVGNVIVAEAMNDYLLKPNKSVNMPGIKLKIPFLSQKDKDDIMFGVKHDIDFIFASFVSKPEDIQDIKELIGGNKNGPLIVAKIESMDGVKHIDRIVDVADGVMVARGDLTAEIPMESLLVAQKHITRRCKRKGKPVIIATQMLENMIKFPVPKRCEITDIGNAVLDFADCIMLSAESAVGERPVDCVKMMSNIALVSERSQDEHYFTKDNNRNVGCALNMLKSSGNVKAIVIFSDNIENVIRIYKGQRQTKPIIVAMNDDRILRRLALYRNILPYKIKQQRVNEKVDIDGVIRDVQTMYEFRVGDAIMVCNRRENESETIKIVIMDK